MTINKQALLDYLNTQFANTQYGAVSAKIKEIYNEVRSGKFDSPSDDSDIAWKAVAEFAERSAEKMQAEIDRLRANTVDSNGLKNVRDMITALDVLIAKSNGDYRDSLRFEKKIIERTLYMLGINSKEDTNE